MSSSTSVLGMTKLTDSENFSNSTLNGNWNILDAFAGKMNGKNTATDLDDVKPTNAHQVVAYNYSNTASNRPCSPGGIVIANGSATYFTQIAYPNYTAGAMPFVRSYGANGFTPWIGLVGSETLATNTNLNDVKTPGFWLLSSSNTYTNNPGGAVLWVGKPNTSGSTVLQIAYGVSKMWTRFATSATAWSTWVEYSTNSLTKLVDITNGSSATFNITNNGRGILHLNGANANAMGELIVACSSTGGMNKKLLGEPSATITTGTNQFTITNNSGVQMNVHVTTMSGTISVAT